MASTSRQRSVQAQWRSGWACDITAGDFRLVADEPSSVPGGTDLGPQPTELLLAAVSSCFAMALSHAARKRSIELDGLEVEATGTYDGPSFSVIRVAAAVGCDPEHVDALMSSAERACYVTNTMRGGVELVFEGRSRRP
jgi:putative redox protein